MNARRAALSVLFAVLLAAVGAAAAYAFHWYVVQPSDGELLAQARQIELPGLVTDGDPAVSGKWAPSFDRGSVVFDATADATVDGAVVRTALEAQGWEGVEVQTGAMSQTVTAARGAIDLDARVWPPDAGVVDVTVELMRGDSVPSLSVTVLLGACLGVVAGAWIGARATRR